MTNLPIMTSTPQAAVPAKQATNAADSSDAQASQPFGQVLARQLGNPAGKDAKVDDKLTGDVLAQLIANSIAGKKDAPDLTKVAADLKKDATTDNGKGDAPAAAPDSAATLPNDMLAALLPQTMTTPVAAPTPAPASAKAETPAVAAGPAQDKQPLGAMRTDVGAMTQTDTAPKTAAANLNAAPQAREQSFAAALGASAGRNANAMDASAAASEALSAPAAAQQPSAAMLAAMQNNAANVAAAAMPHTQATVNTPVGAAKWGDDFNQKITWIASTKQDQTAELHLNPPQLGPVDVVIKVSGDQATALFTSPHAAVRDAIEQAIPKLRDMMADNGIMLGNATVSDQAPRDQQSQQTAAQRAAAPAGNELRDSSAASVGTARVSQISRHNGIVDTFA